MEEVKNQINKLFDSMGCGEVDVSIDSERRRISIITEDEIVKSSVSTTLSALEHLINLLLRKEGEESFILDINNYRKERERLIVELARAAARKASISKIEVDLPPMNSYERRIVHMEISTHPSLNTESAGEGKDRHVVIRPIEEE